MEGKDRADEFLNCYRELEQALAKKYGFDEKTFGSPIVKFLSERESEPFRDRLNLCREIRNFLSHHAEFDGERVLQPSQAIIRFLMSVTDYVRQPPLALTCATLYPDILKATPSQRVLTVMKKMERQGFSHVPVIENGEWVGVFSVSTIFTYTISRGLSAISDEMVIGDFAELLPVDRHITERFQFCGNEATVEDVRVMFEKHQWRSKRLAAVFITDNGSLGGRILGMITPWDLINY